MTQAFSRNLCHISLSSQMREALNENGLHVIGDRLRPLYVRGVDSKVFHDRCGDVEGFVSERTTVVGGVVELHRPQIVHTSFHAWVFRLHEEPVHHAPCILGDFLGCCRSPRFHEVLDEVISRSNEQEDTPSVDRILNLKSHIDSSQRTIRA